MVVGMLSKSSNRLFDWYCWYYYIWCWVDLIRQHLAVDMETTARNVQNQLAIDANYETVHSQWEIFVCRVQDS